MKGRSAPTGGYAFAAKEEFRDYVWRHIANRSPWRERGQHVLLMPSSEGTEIDVALAKGFREDELHVVDHNPAIVATLKRRYPAIQTYGVNVARAHERIASAGIRLYGASLDLCCNATWRSAKLLAICSTYDCWQTGARVVVNVLRGREDASSGKIQPADARTLQIPWVRRVMKTWEQCGVQPNAKDAWRMFMLARAMSRHVVKVRSSRAYVSSNGQSFLTAVLQVYRSADVAMALGSGCTTTAAKRLADAFIEHLDAQTCYTRLAALGISLDALIPRWFVEGIDVPTRDVMTSYDATIGGRNQGAAHAAFARVVAQGFGPKSLERKPTEAV